ncbi:hypothetical protein F441_20841 [Phytophthora nicotianae CJ01A1]|uniref:Uncharacterized protein n=1 Tax=Phytophthora nicotianae CJ01A1 TaxID=1317063 RepID=W2VUH3_PHYNI|nr:hypothetical protein F441_20841 [Phytophthora nicotianae CJ01A1]
MKKKTKTMRAKIKAAGPEEKDTPRLSAPIYRHEDLGARADRESDDTSDGSGVNESKPMASTDLLRLLKNAGIWVGTFDAKALFALDLDATPSAAQELFARVKIVAEEVSGVQLPMDPRSARPRRPTTRRIRKRDPTPRQSRGV